MTSDIYALREVLAEALARDLAREGGWQDPDAPWTENQVIIARGGAGDPVWREYLDDARSLLGREALTSVLSDLAAARAEIEGLKAERDEALDDAGAWERLCNASIDKYTAATARADRLAAENAALREALTEAQACLSSDQPRPDLTEATRLVGLIVRTRGIIRTALTTAPAGAPAEQREGTDG